MRRLILRWLRGPTIPELVRPGEDCDLKHPRAYTNAPGFRVYWNGWRLYTIDPSGYEHPAPANADFLLLRGWTKHPPVG